MELHIGWCRVVQRVVKRVEEAGYTLISVV